MPFRRALTLTVPALSQSIRDRFVAFSAVRRASMDSETWHRKVLKVRSVRMGQMPEIGAAAGGAFGQILRRQAHNLKVRGSNPLPATNNTENAASPIEAAFSSMCSACRPKVSDVLNPRLERNSMA